MKFAELVKVRGTLNYSQLPDELELSINLSFGVRFMAVQSKTKRCETSAALVVTGDEVSFTGAASNDKSHAPIDTTGIRSPAQFVGTLHTHLENTTSATVTAQSVAGFSKYIERADHKKVEIESPTASRTVGPLAYSTVDVMTFAVPARSELREWFSFLFCVPKTLYVLVWARDTVVNKNELYRALLQKGFEEMCEEVMEEAFGLGDDDTVNLDLDRLGPALEKQTVPLTTILSVAKEYRFGVYAANVPLDVPLPKESLSSTSDEEERIEMKPESFKPTSDRLVLQATHSKIILKRFKA